MALLDAAPHTSSGPTLFGMPMKQVSLITVSLVVVVFVFVVAVLVVVTRHR